MTRPTNIGASVHQRLKNAAKGSGRSFNDLAQRYLGCSVREVRNLRYAGLPTIKFRHPIRFEPEAVKVWLRAQL
ncbi:MAG: helix-turn-helix domain-containing protein [Chthoniobacterales bacterium]|jgi:hypothetical protein